MSPPPSHKTTQILKERSLYCDKKLKNGMVFAVINHFSFYNLFILWKGYWSRERGWSMLPYAIYTLDNFVL
jgi:hypothetical protein